MVNRTAEEVCPVSAAGVCSGGGGGGVTVARAVVHGLAPLGASLV